MSLKHSIRASELRKWLPRRNPDSHKGQFGHVLVVGGSRGMSGAVVLAARAALRSGAGLVTAAVPQSVQAVAASCVPEMLTLGLPETQEGSLREDAAQRLFRAHEDRKYSVLAIGPGISHELDAAKAVLAILDVLHIPAVIDADALNILAGQSRIAVEDMVRRREAPCIFTPHPGEMARLCGMTVKDVQADRVGVARGYAKNVNVVCLLKGRGTIITDGAKTVINPTGNPGLAKGGSGDVLTGIIAALWSQFLSAVANKKSPEKLEFKAAVLGAYLHGLSADIAVREKTQFCLLASDVIETLPQAFRRLR